MKIALVIILVAGGAIIGDADLLVTIPLTSVARDARLKGKILVTEIVIRDVTKKGRIYVITSEVKGQLLFTVYTTNVKAVNFKKGEKLFIKAKIIKTYLNGGTLSVYTSQEEW